MKLMSALGDGESGGGGNLPGMPAGGAPGLVKRGRSTGERFALERAEDAESMVRLWLEDPRRFSMRRLAEQFGCSQNTVREVLRARGLLSVDAVGARVREVMDAGLLGLVTRVADDADGVPNSQVPMLIDVLARNRQLLAGGPTEIVESREVVVNVDAWNERLRAARSGCGETGVSQGEGSRVDEGSVIEAVLVGPVGGDGAGIGLEGEKLGALRGPGDVVDEALKVVDEGEVGVDRGE